jgi:hypothetical protein
MRAVVLLTVLAGCAFRPQGDVGDDLVLPDASATTTDGGGGDGATATIDAPPCTDVDQDGTCDDQDPWLCGASPPTVPATVSTGNGVTASISSVAIAGGGNVVTAAPGAALTYSLAWTLRDENALCPGCTDQIEVGIVDGNRHACVYDANPPQNQTQSGTANIDMTAPTTPGLYTLRFKIAQDFSCNAFGRNGWWLGPPDSDATFGAICVR